MQLEFHGRISHPEALEYAKKRVRTALQRVAFAVPRVHIRLGQAGDEGVCRLICELRPVHGSSATGVLVVEAESDDLLESVDYAAERAGERVHRELGRGREHGHERISERLLSAIRSDESSANLGDAAPLSLTG